MKSYRILSAFLLLLVPPLNLVGDVGQALDQKMQMPSIKLTLYSSVSAISKGGSTNLVLEILNEGNDAVRIADSIVARQIVDSGDSEQNLPMSKKEVQKIDPPAGNGLHFILYSHLPPGSSSEHIALEHLPIHVTTLQQIEPNCATFIVLPLPSNAFVVGNCGFIVKSTDDAVSSNWIRVECVHAQDRQ